MQRPATKEDFRRFNELNNTTKDHLQSFHDARPVLSFCKEVDIDVCLHLKESVEGDAEGEHVLI